MLATTRLAIAFQALVLFLFCGKLSATWSIIIIDTRTGEIAVGTRGRDEQVWVTVK